MHSRFGSSARLVSFKELLHRFPDQLVHAGILSEQFSPRTDAPIRNAVICGMGGSGIAGKIAVDLCKSEASIPIQTHADYGLPRFANHETLAIIVSYSGNTEETLSAFKHAKRQHCQIVSITSGGKLRAYDPKAIQIPKGLPPRAAIAFMLVPILAILSKRGVIAKKGNDLMRTILTLRRQKHKIEQAAKSIAHKLRQKTPVIYATPLLCAAATRWQTQFNENAKRIAHTGIVPEMNHNEINAIPNDSHSFFILIHEKLSGQMKKRFAFLKKTIGKKRFVEKTITGKNKLETILSAIHLGDFVSYYHAMLHHENPEVIPLIDKLKKKLK